MTPLYWKAEYADGAVVERRSVPLCWLKRNGRRPVAITLVSNNPADLAHARNSVDPRCGQVHTLQEVPV